MDSHSKALRIAEAALEKKAYDLVIIQIEHLASVADYFVIATGRSDVQVRAITQGIQEHLGKLGFHPLGVEGFSLGHWVVLDYDDVVVHCFFQPTRELYRLESVWSDTKVIELPEPLGSQARELSLRAEVF